MVTFAEDLASYLPSGFEAYARVFHPAGDDRRRWTEIAALHGHVAHPDMQLHAISGSDRDDPPFADEGSLPEDVAGVLIEHLAAATATPDRCWFCVWEGWGTLDHQGVEERVQLPCRSYLLTGGPIDLARRSFIRTYHQSAALWWPEDRAWVVATEIDFGWTYVGATGAAIARLVSDPRIEALVVTADHRGSFDADHINS